MGNKTFKNFLHEVKNNSLEAYENQHYQFEELVYKLGLNKEINRTPLFDTVLEFQNKSLNDLKLNDLIITGNEFAFKYAKFDILVNISEAENGFHLYIDYKTCLFKRSTIERLVKHFITILREISFNSDIKLSDINMFEHEDSFDSSHKNMDREVKLEAEFDI